MHICLSTVLFDVLMLGSIPTAVNQCEEGTHDCEQICLDNGATFTCACNSGYDLARDGRSCEGEPLSLCTGHAWSQHVPVQWTS